MEQRWKKMHFMWRGKRLLALFVSVCLLGMMAPVTARAGSVDQDTDGTYLIRTTEDLVWFAQYVNQGYYTANAILMADVGFTGDTAIGAATVSTNDWNNGYSVTDVTGYQGTFDGNGYIVTMPGNTHLFAAIDGGTVKNLTVTGGSRAIVDYMKSGSILFCTNRSDIKENTNSSDPDKPEQDGHYIGSIVNIVGAASHTGNTDAASLIQGCTNYGSIDSPWCVGGIVGAARGSNITIDSCANYGNIDLKNGRYLGGIVSNLAEGAKVTNCYDQSQRFNVYGGNNGIYYSCTNSSISNCFHVNGDNQSGASKVTGLTDEVVIQLNQGSAAVVWSSDGIAKYGITLSQTEFTYNGFVQKPELNVVNSLEQTLEEGTDYDIVWSTDCTNAGSKNIVVTFKGSYSGTITKMYSIKKQAQDVPNVSINISEETVSTTTEMEYSTDSGNSWTTCLDSMSLSDLGWTGSSLQVMFRLVETDNYIAGNAQYVTIPARPISNLAIDNSAESVTIPDGYRYNTTSVDYSGTWTEGDGSAVKIEPGKSIFIYMTATENAFKSNVQTLTAPGRGENFSAPAINYEAETLATTTAMEYKIVTSGQNDSDWEDCTENMAVTAFGWDGSKAVEVKFRAKSTDSNYASDEQNVTIPARPDKPATGEGCTIDYSGEVLTITGGYAVNTAENFNGENIINSGSISSYTGQTLYICKSATTENFRSAVQAIVIPVRPISNLAIDNSAESVTIPGGYRYNTIGADYSSEWTEGDGSAVKVEPGNSIFIYKTATESNFKSNVQTLTAPGRVENFSAPAMNYEAETLATTTSMEYRIVTSGKNDSAWVNCTENMAVTAFGWDGSEAATVEFRAKSTGSNYASEEKKVIIPARLSAPSGFQEENESGDGKKDGKITGLDRSKSYQYKLVTDPDSEWKNVSSSAEITGLARGHYVVRYAAGNNAFASAGSDSITLYTALGTPTSKWDSNIPGKATWDKVVNASGYSVQLYKNGNEDCNRVGDTINVASDTTEYDFTSVITSVGSYAFKVKAIGAGESYVDSKEETSVCLFTVSFDTNGAGAIDMQLVASGEQVAEPTAPTKTGYSFGGWYSDSKCLADNKWDFATSTVSQVMTLFAKWEANDYTVTLDAKGGTIADGKNVTSYTYGSGVILPSGDDVTYAGYTFAGWYESEDYSGSAVTEISSINIGSKTFYAKWLSQSVDVTYASVSGVEGTISGNTITVMLPYGSIISKDASEVFIKTMEGATHTAFASDDSGSTWTFTVTAEDGTTKANYSIKVFVASNPADGNIADVEAAKSVIEGYDWTVAQATANTQEAVKTWIEQQLAKMNLNGASYTVSIKDGFTAALTGTFSAKDGSNGNFGFNVTISKGVNTGSLASNTYAEAIASVSTGTITAMAYTDNGGSTSDSSSDNSPDTPSAQPEIKGDSGSKGWSAIENKIVEAVDHQTNETETVKEAINIDMKGTSDVPKTVLDAVKGKDIALVFDMGEGISWTVNGKDVIDAIENISLGVKKDTNAIPAEVINKVSRQQTPLQMSLEHDGDFGFTATLTMNLEPKNKGLYANLYYYNPKAPQGKELEFICADKIDESGNADLVFSHASDYTVVIDYAPMDGSAPTAETQAANSLAMNKNAKLTWKSSVLTVKWGAVSGAEGYDIYATTCGKKFTAKTKVASVTADQTTATIKEVLGSKVATDRGYKVMVKAYRMIDGKKQYLGESMDLYAVGNRHKSYTNASAVAPSVKTLTLTVGKTKKVGATITKKDQKKKLLPGKYTASKRYFIADETIATVDEKGNVTAHRKGKTTLYIKAANGVTAKVQIIIK